MERVRIGKDIVFQWEVRKDGAALTAEDAANLTLEIAGRNGKSQRLPFEIRDSKIIAAWYGVQQTEIGAYRLTCWHNRGKVGESVVDVVWAVELVRYTTEETFDDIETVTIELEGGNLTFAALKGASAYEVAVAEGFVGTEAEWLASLKKPAEDAAEDAEEAAARAIEAAENAEASSTRAETAAQSAENAAGDANTAARLANSAADNAEAKAQLADTAADNAEAKAQLADTAADNANTAATEAYSKAQEADTAATTATNAAQSANSAAASADEAARGAVEAAVEATQSAENAQTQADNARYAADYANEMAIAAEKVNAQLNGNVLTITNRQGTSTSVNTKGEQGEQGNPGQAATISVGTTTTGAPGTSAQVTNSGTSSAAVLDFAIPQGAKGDKGDQGEPGEVTEAELTEKLATKANTDGYYSRMIVGGAESLIGDVPQTATYTFRRSGGGAIGEPVARLTEVQGNTGVVNQQANPTWVALAPYAEAESLGGNRWRITMPAGRPTAQFYFTSDFVNGHIYLSSFVVPSVASISNIAGAIMVNNSVVQRPSPNRIFTFTSSDAANARYICQVNRSSYSETETFDTNSPMFFDLTLEYGAGNEPGTVAEFEQRIWRDYGKTLDEYIAYTTGKLINCKALALESAGFNQWDEEWELGTWGVVANDIMRVESSTQIRNKNLIPVLPSTTYCITNISGNTSGYFVVGINDADTLSGSVLRRRVVGQTQVFTTESKTRYIGFSMAASYGTTYNHDICINISDAAINGTYKPYKKDVVNLNLTTLTGINPTTEVREVVFPNGMRSKGDVRDVISGNTATVKIGDPTQETPLENTILATPIVYTDLQYSNGTPFVLPKNFEVQNDGTERITHAEGEDSIAPVMSAIYGLNAVGFVQDAPKDYTSQATLDSLVSVLSSITGRTISKSWDASQNKWTFSAQ